MKPKDRQSQRIRCLANDFHGLPQWPWCDFAAQESGRQDAEDAETKGRRSESQRKSDESEGDRGEGSEGSEGKARDVLSR